VKKGAKHPVSQMIHSRTAPGKSDLSEMQSSHRDGKHQELSGLVSFAIKTVGSDPGCSPVARVTHRDIRILQLSQIIRAAAYPPVITTVITIYGTRYSYSTPG
jgi:hypothetical protein